VNLNWIFAPNNGGRDNGLNDAGIETFKGNLDRYLARELIQNSLDARNDTNKPAIVKFELLKLAKADVPGLDQLTHAIVKCAEFWKTNTKAERVFRKAEQISRQDTITVLRIGDYNTRGVCGSETEHDRDWYNLIRCAGSSSKGAGEGGSFGIGKNAPFAASALRTVFYSTYNIDGEVIFQGVATLASHTLPTGQTAQNIGYYGGEGGLSVRNENHIPAQFKRGKLGTDISILGFPASEQWDRDLVFSVLDNFWPAIHFGDLEVTVGATEITRSTLPALLEKFSHEAEFTAHLYYTAFTQPTHTFLSQTLTKLGNVDLYLFTGPNELPRKVAMIRKAGMVVFAKRFRSVMPYCGVFLCRNDQGNNLLRDMEPPRHDEWNADIPEKGVNRKVETEYVGFIRDCIRKLTPIDDSKVIAIPGLNRFLPDDDDTEEQPFETTGEEKANESPNRRPLPEKIAGERVQVHSFTPQRDSSKPTDGTEATTETEGELDGSGGKPIGKGGANGDVDGGPGGGDAEGRTQTATGQTGGNGTKPAIAVRYRTFSTNNAAGVYRVDVSPQEQISKPFNIVLSVVGDDQKAVASLKSARYATGGDLAVSSDFVVGPISIPKKWPVQLEVVLDESMPVAMEVHAHEA